MAIHDESAGAAALRPGARGGAGPAGGAARAARAPLAGKSTLNRLEHGAAEADRYRRIARDGAAIEALFVDLFLDAHAPAPKEILLDLDATDDPLHGHQEGRFFHGYYDGHCYLPRLRREVIAPRTDMSGAARAPRCSGPRGELLEPTGRD